MFIQTLRGTSGFLLGSYFTHSSMVCFYSEFLFGVSTVQVRVCLWRANERRRVRTAASAPTAVFRSNDDAVMQAWPLCGTWQGVEPRLPTHAVQVLSQISYFWTVNAVARSTWWNLPTVSVVPFNHLLQKPFLGHVKASKLRELLLYFKLWKEMNMFRVGWTTDL